MNGVALFVALAALGVDYNVQRAEDGKLEYVIQIEPEFLKSLADGQEIHSDVPPEAGAVERVLVRVGTAAPKHSQANITEYRRLLVAGSRFASTDPRAAPDGAASIVWPAKTKPELTYNVKYGWQPDQAGHLAYYVQLEPTLLQTLAAGDEIRAGIDPAAGRVGRFVIRAGSDELPKIPVEPVATAAPLAEANIAPRGRFDAGPQDTYGPAPSAAPPLRRPATPLSSTPDYAATSPAISTLPIEQPAYSPRGGSRLDARNEPAFDPRSQYQDNQYGPARAAIEPPLDYGPPNSVARTGGEQQPQFPPRTYAPLPQYSQQPIQDDRLATANRPSTASAPLAAPQITTTGLGKSTLDGASPEKPWMPLMFTAFALFMSIGGNLYLGWTAAEFYSRYRLATERLRSAGRT